MKIRSLIFFLLFFVSFLTYAEEEESIVSAKLTREEIVIMLKTELAEMTQETPPFAIFGVEEIMSQAEPPILHEEIGSNTEKFTQMKIASCRNTGTSLALEINDRTIPFNLIDELEDILLLCNMTYSDVGISRDFLQSTEKQAYISLAKEALQNYQVTKNEILLRRFQHFVNAGQLTAQDVGMKENDFLTLR